ncbi:hypothetical protein BJX96DRAFT_157081 [Aspergillus floccosus]
MAQSAVRLLDLPTEIHLQIISYLGYPSCLALSQTSSFFRSMIAVGKPLTSEQKLSFLCTAENWTRYKGRFSCSRCLKLRLRAAFADKQVKAKRAKGHAESDRRFCLDCGIKKRIYQPGQMIDINGITHFVCGLCRQMCGSGLYCTFCGSCQRCLERRSSVRNSYLSSVTEPELSDRECPRCLRPYRSLGETTQECNGAKVMTVLHNLPLALKMAEFQEDSGMMASPEWYEEDIAKGTF